MARMRHTVVVIDEQNHPVAEAVFTAPYVHQRQTLLQVVNALGTRPNIAAALARAGEPDGSVTIVIARHTDG